MGRKRLPDNAALRAAAEQVWAYLFDGEVFPEWVKIRWAWDMGKASGRATVGGIYRRGFHGNEGPGWVMIEYPFASNPKRCEHPLGILVHEFAHLRGWHYHTRAFYRRVNDWLEKLSLPRLESE